MRKSIQTFLLGLAICAAPASADPEVGDLLDTTPGHDFRGWYMRAGAIAADGTSYDLFEQSGVWIIALTIPIAREPSGGISAEKITRLARVTAHPGEVYVNGPDCSLLGSMPALAFYSKAKGTARAFFVFRDEIREERWLPSKDEACEYGGD